MYEILTADVTTALVTERHLYNRCLPEEACWAHNPEVRGPKPRSANNFILFSSYV